MSQQVIHIHYHFTLASGDMSGTQPQGSDRAGTEYGKPLVVPPSVERVLRLHDYTEESNGRIMTAQEAFKWLKNEADPERAPSELKYLPSNSETYARYLRKGQKLLGIRRNSPRYGRDTGSSVVHERNV